MTKIPMVLAAAVGMASSLFNPGVATATPDVTGMTYSEAQSQIQNSGLTPQVSARVGDRLSEGDCIVTGVSRSATPARGFANGGPSSVVLVALDCNGNVASPGKSGYSAGSPQGRKLLKEQKEMAWKATDEGQAWCRSAEQQHPEWGQIPGCDLE
jgi:hypothetical protein